MRNSAGVFEKSLQVLYQIIMASTFSKYATPVSLSAFSASSMTYERATELAYPKIYGSLLGTQQVVKREWPDRCSVCRQLE